MPRIISGMATSSCSRSRTAPALFRCFKSASALHAAGGIGCSGAQQFAKLVGGARSEPAIGAARQPGDLAERLLANRIVALLKHESGHVAQPKLAGGGTEIVERFLHRVADKNQRTDLRCVVFPAGVGKNFSDLGVAAAAIDPRHQRAEPVGLRDPRRCFAFGQVRDNRQAGYQARRRQRLRGTCRLAAGRRCPRSVAGSSWHRAQKSSRPRLRRLSQRARAPSRDRERRRSRPRRRCGRVTIIRLGVPVAVLTPARGQSALCSSIEAFAASQITTP